VSECLGGWVVLPREAACWDETEDLLINRFVASDDFREGGSVGTVSEVDGRTSRDGRGSDLAGRSSVPSNSVAGLHVDSDGGGGDSRGGSMGEGGTSCRGNDSMGIAGKCGGLSEAGFSIIQGGREASILEKVLLLPCRLPFPFSFGVGVVASLSLSCLGCSVDLLPKDIRLISPINTLLPSVPSPRSRSLPLYLSLETDRTIRWVKSSMLAEKLVREAEADRFPLLKVAIDEACLGFPPDPLLELIIIEFGRVENDEGDGSRLGRLFLRYLGDGPKPRFSMLFPFFSPSRPTDPRTPGTQLPPPSEGVC